MLKRSDFIHLHTHSDGSLNDSIITIPELIQRVKNMGQKGIAITDHNSMINIPLLVEEAEQHNIKPIIGDEFYIVPDREKFFSNKDRQRYHIIVVAKNNEGLKNLIRLNNDSWKTNYFKSRAGLNMSVIDIKQLVKYHKGNIVTSACYYGIIPKLLYDNKKELTMIYDAIKQTYKDDFYLEVADHGVEEETKVFKKLIEFGKKNNDKIIVTQDAHYFHRDQALPHEVLISTRFNYHSKFKYDTYEYYLKTSQEMYALGFAEKYYKNTMEIYEKIEKYNLIKRKNSEKVSISVINESKITFLELRKIAKKIIMYYNIPKTEWREFIKGMKSAKNKIKFFQNSSFFEEINEKYNLYKIIPALLGVKNNIVADENRVIPQSLENINFPIMRKGNSFITQWPSL
ncbi:PHP domain-containing protein [bacterium]|nr:PHP domain-containing protein [bacterium]